MNEKIYCKSGGCSAKLGAKKLSHILEKIESFKDENVLVGFDSRDDAAVYQIDESHAFVSTLDFFPPMVEDPYLYGQIAATNALSDIYAMNGTPKTALNIVCFPENEDLNILGKIIEGGNSKLVEAGCALVGGHSNPLQSKVFISYYLTYTLYSFFSMTSPTTYNSRLFSLKSISRFSKSSLDTLANKPPLVCGSNKISSVKKSQSK